MDRKVERNKRRRVEGEGGKDYKEGKQTGDEEHVQKENPSPTLGTSPA